MSADPAITVPLIFIAVERGLSFLAKLSRGEPASAEAIARAIAREIKDFKPPSAYEIANAVGDDLPRKIGNEFRGIIPR